MSNWERREALAMVDAIEQRMRGLSLADTERMGLRQVTWQAKKAAETCETTAYKLQAIRSQLCAVCVSGRLNGCGPANAGTSRCFWLAGEATDSTGGLPPMSQ